MTATRFVPTINPFTHQEVIEFVPVPKINTKRKGTTQYDDKFEKLLEAAKNVLSHKRGEDDWLILAVHCRDLEAAIAKATGEQA